MGDKPKTLCNWDEKRIRNNIDKLRLIVDSPRFVCKNCARVANKKKYLCDPIRLTPK